MFLNKANDDYLDISNFIPLENILPQQDEE